MPNIEQMARLNGMSVKAYLKHVFGNAIDVAIEMVEDGDKVTVKQNGYTMTITKDEE